MTNIGTEICNQIKAARRAAGLSQSDLAKEVGCNQSALSMFEQGQTTKLNDEVVSKLAQRFGIELNTGTGKEKVAIPREGIQAALSLRGFCPNPHCPSNSGYQVEELYFYRPNREMCDPVGGKFCAVCGEVLEKRCPNCGSPVHDGAVCSFCGQRYISV